MKLPSSRSYNNQPATWNFGEILASQLGAQLPGLGEVFRAMLLKDVKNCEEILKYGY
jgi:hypothetical protein